MFKFYRYLSRLSNPLPYLSLGPPWISPCASFCAIFPPSPVFFSSFLPAPLILLKRCKTVDGGPPSSLLFLSPLSAKPSFQRPPARDKRGKKRNMNDKGEEEQDPKTGNEFVPHENSSPPPFLRGI